MLRPATKHGARGLARRLHPAPARAVLYRDAMHHLRRRGRRRLRGLAVALSALAVLAALLLPRTGHAQQNFFNVPASEVTRQGKVFFQEQVNVLTSQKKLQSNSHFAYGIGAQLEVGLNISHVNIKPFSRRVLPINTRDRSEPYSPLVLGTAQKAFAVGDHFLFAVGTQTGVNFGAPLEQKALATLSYANAVVLLPRPHARLVAGAYYGNTTFLGAGAGLGVWLGAEVQVLPERIHLVVDWISGSHDLGLGVVGANVFFSRNVSLVFGPILPNPGSGNGTGYVLELNMLDLLGTLGIDDDDDERPRAHGSVSRARPALAW